MKDGYALKDWVEKAIGWILECLIEALFSH
jgi:hypothetical protein